MSTDEDGKNERPPQRWQETVTVQYASYWKRKVMKTEAFGRFALPTQVPHALKERTGVRV